MIASVRCPQLVGREEQTALLRKRFSEAEERRGSLTFISGDAGIGKTRLVGDFLQLPEIRRAPRAIGYCMEHARSPLAPLADVIWSLHDENPDILSPAPQLQRTLARLVPSLASDSDARETVGDSRAQYSAIVEFIRRAGEKRPVIVVLEDAQWADLSSVDFVAYFAGRLAGTRAMMLVMKRQHSDAIDPLDETLVRLRANESVFSVSLAGLALNDIRKLSSLALGDTSRLGNDVLRRVHELADGNPLFAEELLGTALSSNGTDVTLPASLRSLFLDRFSGLDSEDRDILTEAAVMGRSFDPAFLAQLTGRPLERILRALRHARELQLVDDEADGVVFRHALVRESLYASLLGAESRRLHRRMAEELESQPESMARAAALAYHWWSARVPEKAFEANVLAGELAMGRVATTDAAVFFERALSCLTNDAATRAEIECKLGLAFHASSSPDRGAAAYERALGYYRSTGDMRKCAEVLLELGRHNAALGRGDDAFRWRVQAIEAVEQLDDEAFRSTAFAHVAWSMFVRGDIVKTREYLGRARSIAVETVATRLDIAEATIFTDLFSGDLNRSEQGFEELRSWLIRDGTTSQKVRAYSNYSLIQKMIGRIDVALDIGRAALALTDDSLAPTYHLSALGILGQALIGHGDLPEAADILARAERLASAHGDPSTRSTAVLIPLGIDLGLHSGRDDLIQRYAVPAILEEAFNSREYPWISSLGSAFLRAAARTEDREAIQTILRRILPYHSAVPMMPDVALHFAYWGRSEDAERASELLARWPADLRSIAAYRSLFDAYVARRAGRSHATLARDAAKRFEGLHLPLLAARSYEVAGDEEFAIAIYTRLSCDGDLQRLRASREPSSTGDVKLSAREREVLPHVLRGKSNAEIASVLSISERTVESHVRSILAKRGVKSRLQLVSESDETT